MDLGLLAHGNNLLSQTSRNYITFVLPPRMSEFGKKVPEDSDWRQCRFWNKPEG